MIYWQELIFGKFVCGKLIGEFYIGDFVPRAIEHVQIETNGRFYIGSFCIDPPIANINSSPIKHLVLYIYIHNSAQIRISLYLRTGVPSSSCRQG